MWLEPLRTLGRRRRAVAIDLPGHGDSEGSGLIESRPTATLSKSLLRRSGLSELSSWATRWAAPSPRALHWRTPELLAGLVLVGTGARLRVQPQILAGLRADTRRTVELVTGLARAPGAPAELLRQDADALLRTPVPVIEGDLLACDAFDLMEHVKTITLPTLIICGTDDRMTPPKYADYLHRQINGSQRTLIPAAGHMVMLEQPDKVSREIEAFLERLA